MYEEDELSKLPADCEQHARHVQAEQRAGGGGAEVAARQQVVQEDEGQGEVLPQRHREGHPGHVEPERLPRHHYTCLPPRGHVSPAGGDHGGGEHAGQPGAREAPGQQVEAAEVDTLQAEHRSRVM